MNRIVLIYGAIAGVIVGTLLLLSQPLWDRGILTFENGAVVGYTTMVIALSMIYFGVRSFRDNVSNGTVTFGRALGIGLLITLVASLFYATAWEISFRSMSTDFIANMEKYYVDQAIAQGKSQEDLAGMKKNFEMYQVMPIRFGMTLLEIIPVGLLISLLSAALLRRTSVSQPS